MEAILMVVLCVLQIPAGCEYAENEAEMQKSAQDTRARTSTTSFTTESPTAPSDTSRYADYAVPMHRKTSRLKPGHRVSSPIEPLCSPTSFTTESHTTLSDTRYAGRTVPVHHKTSQPPTNAMDYSSSNKSTAQRILTTTMATTEWLPHLVVLIVTIPPAYPLPGRFCTLPT